MGHHREQVENVNIVNIPGNVDAVNTYSDMPPKRAKPPAGSSASDERPYHHGDLRSALIKSAVQLLRDEGPEALTLRAVARAAGVSQAAPYRHFADRRALVAAVAEEGFRALEAAMRRAMQRAEGGPRLALKQVAIAYVRFAHQHPAEYRTMFGRELAQKDDVPSLGTTSRSVLDFVRTGIEQLQAAGLVAPGDAGAMAVATWSMLHGVAILSLDGQAAVVTRSLDQLLETTTHMMMFGMAPRS
jgi:AcrR family transcriptional regulator